ncbi:DHH family phosphoesterase [Phycisphaera mikurensis]|uniref:DHH family protein n=1 Tax=Phycisphaera mikurensis (strain NBRC 102666 / KCTC 22515 / FYK2301M01) TaxID=1142394 RepID=I0IG46_PHYMF|nr:DHH family phosphoesterase [Phycisphaera mikurensis]MBB6440383.1 phosphoesterase RecJ-like protein [Phycisphaera mikurensis]BAM04234.1 DHH family protein [Phycisphaera mikurensis NBRC 102666]
MKFTPAPQSTLPSGGYTRTAGVAEAAARLTRSGGGTRLLFTHAKPDGDALGSVLALQRTLHDLGIPADAVVVPPVPDPLRRLRGFDRVEVWTPAWQPPADVDQVVVLDTGAWSQLGPVGPVVEANLPQTLIIDHHLGGDVNAPHRLIDGEAAAACELVAEVVQGLVRPDHPEGKREGDSAGYKPLPHVTRDALFVGIASDTGWFRFSNVRPRTHELAAALIRMGCDHAALYGVLEQADRVEKLDLLTRALMSLQRVPEADAAVMVLRKQDFEETGARSEETERVIDVPQSVDAINVVVLLSEVSAKGGDVTRMSFRSKPSGPGGGPPINVSDLAARFGGGGHARAAGARQDGPVSEVLPRVLAALRELGAPPSGPAALSPSLGRSPERI